MIKKILFSGCIALTASSFSFWKMEGLYGDSFKEITKLDRKNPEQINWAEIKNYFCYDKHTGNWLNLYISTRTSYGPNGAKTWNNLTSIKKHCFKFLTCDFDYENFWEADNLEIINDAYEDTDFDWYSFTYKKQLLNFTLDRSIKKEAFPKEPFEYFKEDIYMSISSNAEDSDMKQLKKKNVLFRNHHRINFRKSFTSASGVEINNTDKGVVLKKDFKENNLISLLRTYWNDASDLNTQNFATSLVNNYHLSSKEESIKKQKALDGMDKYNAFPMSAFDLNRLNTCTILAVWCLIPVEVDAKDENGKDIKKIIESQMLGLAKDKDGNLFHWTTDLGKDISEFMPNIPKPSDNSTTDSSTSTSS